MNLVPLAVLLVWMANNIRVTLLNKAAFVKVDFNYPFALTCVHMACNTLGAKTYQLIRNRRASPAVSPARQNTLPMNHNSNPTQKYSKNQWVSILGFSIIFSLNIAVGNLSLRFVSVNFNQVMRSLVPAITLCWGLLVQGKQFSKNRRLSVVVVVCGVACACYGDMTFDTLGFVVTLCCVILAAAKVVASGEILTGDLKMDPVDLLSQMAPLALLQCSALSFMSGEVSSITSRWQNELSPAANPEPLVVVFASGLLSFTLNMSSLYANKLTSPLTLCIAANVKQVLMIAASTLL
mmetsp:Transcript_26794/g.53422  ORF Transcript_26794/g.53422 Transcript_26794/m.53422 type:complete len:294 (-) Transcript_26794:85-966(-)